jgi:hypothetical protein
VPGGRALRVGAQPARGEAGEHALGDALDVRADLRVAVVAVPRDRAVDVGPRHALGPGEAPQREPRERRGRLAGLGDREVEQAPGEGVGDDRDDRPDVAPAATRASCSAATVGHVARDDGELVRVRRARDRGAQEEGRAALGGEQVHVVDDTEQRARRRQHREVADAAVEHLDEHLAAEAGPPSRCRRGRSSRSGWAGRPTRRLRSRACAGRGR